MHNYRFFTLFFCIFVKKMYFCILKKEQLGHNIFIMGEMQFCAMVLMTLLTMTLIVLMPRKVYSDKVLDRSRWLLTIGTALMAIQFFLQYLFDFRDLGVTQAVMVNLVFFIPCASLFTISIINLLQRGKVGRTTWIVGFVSWILVVLMMLGASLIHGVPLLADTPEMRTAEYLSAIVYMLAQAYYTIILYRGNVEMKRALDNFYDHDASSMVRWISRSTVLLAVVAVGAPFLIFSTGLPLLIYSLVIFCSLYYLVFSFICYCVSNDSNEVMEASDTEDENEEEESNIVVSDEDTKYIELAIEHWVDEGRYLRRGLTINMAVREMGIPRYQLTAWLKTTKWELFNPWLAHLRIKHACELLDEHPDWGNDFVSRKCGFSSRSYFQQIFKKQTGMTPAQYVRRKQ